MCGIWIIRVTGLYTSANFVEKRFVVGKDGSRSGTGAQAVSIAVQVPSFPDY